MLKSTMSEYVTSYDPHKIPNKPRDRLSKLGNIPKADPMYKVISISKAKFQMF